MNLKLVLLCLIISVKVFGQDEKVYQGKPLYYSEVVTIDSVSKNELYDMAIVAISKAYKNPKEVIKLENKESGTILIGGVQVERTSEYMGELRYTFTLSVKDGRYKYEIKDFVLNGKKLFSWGWGPLFYENNDTITTNTDYTKSYFESNKQKKKLKPYEHYQYFHKLSQDLANTLISIMKENIVKPKKESNNW